MGEACEGHFGRERVIDGELIDEEALCLTERAQTSFKNSEHGKNPCQPPRRSMLLLSPQSTLQQYTFQIWLQRPARSKVYSD